MEAGSICCRRSTRLPDNLKLTTDNFSVKILVATNIAVVNPIVVSPNGGSLMSLRAVKDITQTSPTIEGAGV